MKQNIGKLGKDTRRARKMIRGLGTLAYDEKMTRYGFSKFEEKKNKGKTNRSIHN